MSQEKPNQFVIFKLEQKVQQLNLLLLPEGRINLQQAKDEFVGGLIDVRTLTERIKEIKDKFTTPCKDQQTIEPTTEAQQQFLIPNLKQQDPELLIPFTEEDQTMFKNMKAMNQEERKNFVGNNPAAKKLLRKLQLFKDAKDFKQ